MVNNLAASLLAGVTVKEKEMQDKIIELRGKLPEQLKSDPDRDPWSITFAKSRPVSVKFNDQGVQITVRGQRYTSGEREFRAMNVTANYKIKPYGSSYRLVRDEELQIAPPTSWPARLGSRSTSCRSKRYCRPDSASCSSRSSRLRRSTLGGQLEKVGPLDLKQLQITSGWLVAAWLRRPSQKATNPSRPQSPSATTVDGKANDQKVSGG